MIFFKFLIRLLVSSSFDFNVLRFKVWCPSRSDESHNYTNQKKILCKTWKIDTFWRIFYLKQVSFVIYWALKVVHILPSLDSIDTGSFFFCQLLCRCLTFFDDFRKNSDNVQVFTFLNFWTKWLTYAYKFIYRYEKANAWFKRTRSFYLSIA